MRDVSSSPRRILPACRLSSRRAAIGDAAERTFGQRHARLRVDCPLPVRVEGVVVRDVYGVASTARA